MIAGSFSHPNSLFLCQIPRIILGREEIVVCKLSHGSVLSFININNTNQFYCVIFYFIYTGARILNRRI